MRALLILIVSTAFIFLTSCSNEDSEPNTKKSVPLASHPVISVREEIYHSYEEWLTHMIVDANQDLTDGIKKRGQKNLGRLYRIR